MPFIPIKQAEVSPVAGVPQSRANPDAFGANIGRATQQLGGAVANFGGAVADLANKNVAQDRQLRVAEAYANADFTPTELAMFNDAPVGGQGYAQGVGDAHSSWVDERVAEYAAKWPGDKEGADDLRLKLLSQRQRILSSAARDEYTMAAESSTLASNNGLSVQLNSIRADPSKYDQALQAGVELISAQPGYDNTAKAKGVAAFKSQAATAYFEAQLAAAEKNPDPVAAMQGIRNELVKDKWKNEFTAEHYELVLNAIERNMTSAGTALKSVVTARLTDYEQRLAKYDGTQDVSTLLDPAELSAFANDVARYAPEKINDLQMLIDRNDLFHQLKGQSVEQLKGERDRASQGPLANAPGKAGIQYVNQGATRNRRVTPQLEGLYKTAADAAGIDAVRVVSGGQPAAGEGGKRTGSTRHDHGNAGDIQLIKNGRVLDFTNPNDLPIIMKFISTAHELGATGIGAGTNYMGTRTFHVGYGTAAIWGAGGAGANAPAWLREATSGAVRPGMGSGGGGLSLLPQAQQGVVSGVANKYGVPANLLAGMWRQESGGTLTPGVSKAGAKGPFQFTDATWAQYGNGGDVNNFNDAADAAGRYMQDLMKQFDGDLTLALMAYNWGPGAVRTWIKEGKNPNAIPVETQDYVQKVLGFAGANGGGNGYMSARDFNRYGAYNTVIENTQKAVSSNMMDFAINNPIPTYSDIAPLDLSAPTPEAFAQRGQDMMAVAAYHNVSPDDWKAFTPAEENVLKSIMQEGNDAQQLALLAAIAGMPQSAQDAALKQLGQTDGVFAGAGRMVADGRSDTALGVMQGRKRLTTKDGVPVPWLKNADQAFTDAAGDSLAGFDPKVLGPIQGMVNALYANNNAIVPGAATAEDVNQDLYAQAFADVMGMDVGTVNGVTTILPKGLDDSTVNAFMDSATTDDWAAVSETGEPPVDRTGTPVEPWAMAGARLFLIDDQANYKVATDTGFLVTPSGKAFIVHLDPAQINETVAANNVAATEALREVGRPFNDVPPPIIPSADSPLLPGAETLQPLIDLQNQPEPVQPDGTPRTGFIGTRTDPYDQLLYEQKLDDMRVYRGGREAYLRVLEDIDASPQYIEEALQRYDENNHPSRKYKPK